MAKRSCDWPEHKLAITQNLDRLEKKFDDYVREQKEEGGGLHKRVRMLEIETGKLQVKAGLWGGLTALVMLGLIWLKNKLFGGGA